MEQITRYYTAVLEFKKENQINKKAIFLNLNIRMQKTRFQTILYNSFNTISMQYKSSNIPHKIFYFFMSAEYSEDGKQQINFRTLYNLLKYSLEES